MWKLIFSTLFYCGCALTEKSRVCYYRNKSYNGKGIAKLVPEDIDPFLCTVINYAFLRINLGTLKLEMTMHNDGEIIARLNALKTQNPELKLVISVGGWNHERRPRFSNMVHTAETRKTFIDSVIAFLSEHNLDGVSYDWMYPGSRPANTPTADKFCLSKLFMETYYAFKNISEMKGTERYSLTASVAASTSKIRAGYQIKKVAMYVDRVDVMAHSLWGYWKGTSGSPTAMDGNTPTVKQAVMAWIDGGMPPNKINLVITSFGRSFKLVDPEKNELSAPVNGAGKAGMHTKSKGILAYYEICSAEWSSKTLWKDSKTLTPYASYDNVWVGYDSEPSIRYKVENVVNKMDLNGITFWALDWDDFSGTKCNKGRFPLLSEAVNAMVPPEITGCEINPCKNNGECHSNGTAYACKCKLGFTGVVCGTKDYCAMSPCLNGGTCKNKADSFECICTHKYIGETCNRCHKDHTICSLFDDPAYYCKHVWMMVNCKVYCGECKSSPQVKPTIIK